MTGRYAPAALSNALAFVRAIATRDAADLLAAIIIDRNGDGTWTPFDAAELVSGTGMTFHPEEEPKRLTAVLRDFADTFGFEVGRLVYSTDGIVSPPLFVLSEGMVAALEGGFPHVARRDPPVPDSASGVWVDTVRAAVASGRGAHLGLRCDTAADDAIHDFAALVKLKGVPVSIASGANAAAVILRAELHAAEAGGVVAVPGHLLAKLPDDHVLEGGLDDAALSKELERPGMRAAMRNVRNVYVWRMGAGSIPTRLRGLVAGVVGPLGIDPAWSRFVVGAAAPEAGAAGIDAIIGAVGDPRRADVVVDMARFAATAAGAGFDEGAGFVARSFGPRLAGSGPSEPLPKIDFDPHLVSADHDPIALLERARVLRRLGCGILFCGPPGGGKSALAAELCRRMVAPAPGATLRGEVPVLVATAADLLVREYGGTERLLAGMFGNAAVRGGIDGASPILVDELDSFCAVRDPSASGGNAYLVRSLTNEWIRALDANPTVPVVATCNDARAIEPAVLRRFALVVTVAADLPPDLERLAWTSILKTDPPGDWKPVGASVSDVAAARGRCAALGDDGPAALAAAIALLRATRVGVAGGTPSRRRSVH